MIREAVHTNIGHFEDILNVNNKIVERNNKKLIEPQQNTGRYAYHMVAKLIA